MRHTLNWIHTSGRTPLNEWSARWKAAACITHSTTPETNIHAFSGIRTHDSSNRAAAVICVRPHGHRDWQTVCSLFKCWLTPRSRNRPLNPKIPGLSWYSVIVVKACLVMLYGVPHETPAWSIRKSLNVLVLLSYGGSVCHLNFWTDERFLHESSRQRCGISPHNHSSFWERNKCSTG
jgi:hypothetical protein